jgi:hypothetical protein
MKENAQRQNTKPEKTLKLNGIIATRGLNKRKSLIAIK